MNEKINWILWKLRVHEGGRMKKAIRDVGRMVIEWKIRG
jgi:hypothetical protein